MPPSLPMDGFAAQPAPAKPTWPANLLLTLPFLLLFWVDLAHHQLWRDEINAWALALASPNLGRLFLYVHYEGHPWLWYFLLWLPTRVLHTPTALKVLEALFGSAIYLILGLLSPFTRLQKLLLFCSYFVVFEYTVLSRMYSVMFLGTLLYVVLRTRKPGAVFAHLALLGLIANTDTAGLLLSCALFLEYLYTWYSNSRLMQATRPFARRNLALAALLYAALLALSVLTLLPAHDISWQASGHLGSQALDRHHLTEALGDLIAEPWWPISHSWPRHFWGGSSMDNKKLFLLVPVVLFSYWQTFRRHRNLLLLMGLTLAAGVLFADVIYLGHARNWGIVFLAFLAALWLQQAQPAPPRSKTAQSLNPDQGSSLTLSITPSAWSYGLLALSALAGLFATIGSWTHPFSEAGPTAAWVRANRPGTPVVADWDYISANLGEHLQQPVYFLSCGCTDTFRLFRNDRDEFFGNQLPQRLNRAMDSLHTTHLLLATYQPLTAQSFRELRQGFLQVTPVATFTGSEEEREDFYLNDVTRDAALK